MNPITKTHKESLEEFEKNFGNIVNLHLISSHTSLLRSVLESIESEKTKESTTLKFRDIKRIKERTYNKALDQVKTIINQALKEIK